MADAEVLPPIRTLTAAEIVFCGEYLVDFQPVAAARRAKLPEPTKARNLLKDPAIHAELVRITGGLIHQSDYSADDVVKELSNLAFANMDDYTERGDDGEIRFDFKKVTRDQMAAVRAVTVEEFMVGSGDEARPVRRTKLELWDKRGALSDLGRYFGIFKQPDTQVNIALILSADDAGL